VGYSRRRRMDSGMRWLLSSATSHSMASSNADRVVMATVPGFGFPVDAPNVATPRGLRNGKTQTERRLSQANVFVTTSTGCLPIKTINTGTIGKSGRETHTMAAKPSVSTQIKRESRKEIPSWAPKIQDTLTHKIHTHD
jgi:hypothetical protein